MTQPEAEATQNQPTEINPDEPGPSTRVPSPPLAVPLPPSQPQSEDAAQDEADSDYAAPDKA